MKSSFNSHKDPNHEIFRELKNYKINKQDLIGVTPSKDFKRTENCKHSKGLNPKETLEFMKNEYIITTASSNSLKEKTRNSFIDTSSLCSNEKYDYKIKSGHLAKSDEKIKTNDLFSVTNNENLNMEEENLMIYNISFQKEYLNDDEKEFSLSDVQIQEENNIFKEDCVFKENNLLNENDSCKRTLRKFEIKKKENLNVSPIKKFTKSQESQFKDFERIMEENKTLKQKNQEYSKKIETLTKELNKHKLKTQTKTELNQKSPKSKSNTFLKSNEKALTNEIEFFKELIEKYQQQCSLMAEEIISLRTDMAKIKFEGFKIEQWNEGDKIKG